MAAETAATRAKARRAKDLALDKSIEILENPEKYRNLYEQTFLTVLKNAVPRTQEITGEEGEAIKITFDSVFNEATRKTTGDNTEFSQI